MPPLRNTSRLRLSHLLTSLLLLATHTSASPNPSYSNDATYDYIIAGSGPGGGPLAANLARAGYSVLLLEAGDDQGSNLHQLVGAWGGTASNDPSMRWDFFVKYHSDDKITKRYRNLTWRQRDGRFYVGTEPPEGAEMLGVYYPRAGTLGGCSTHNAMAAAMPSDSDWDVVAELTGDASWMAKNMRKHFKTVENNHYVPKSNPTHGFNGYLDICLNDRSAMTGKPELVALLQTTAKVMGQNPAKLQDLLQRDLNSADADRDQQTGLYGFPSHRTPEGVRSSARNPVADVLAAKKYKLTLQLSSLVTKVLFDEPIAGKPRAIGVAFLQGKSLYSADPRYNASSKGVPGQAYARREVIISGGTFNSPQILKLSGIGPKAELQKFKIPVIVDSPGVGANMQDNYEIGVIARAAVNFTQELPVCTYGDIMAKDGTLIAADPCLELWRQGKGPYARGLTDALMYKTKHAALNERDLFMWGEPFAFRGFWPEGANQGAWGSSVDPPSTFGFSMAKMHPSNRAGTVTLRSADPRERPEIQFRFFEDADAEKDLDAMVEGIELGRRVFDATPAPLGPWTETEPCEGGRNNPKCDVKKWIREQAWSHHATSSCAIGADGDRMAVLDSEFRVRGVKGLRVVDASVFPRVPGGFPVLPTFVVSEKAAEVILREARRY